MRRLPLRTRDLQSHVELRFGVDGHSECMLRGYTGVGNILPFSKRLAPFGAVGDAADSGRLRETDYQIASYLLRLR